MGSTFSISFICIATTVDAVIVTRWFLAKSLLLVISTVVGRDWRNCKVWYLCDVVETWKMALCSCVRFLLSKDATIYPGSKYTSYRYKRHHHVSLYEYIYICILGVYIYFLLIAHSLIHHSLIHVFIHSYQGINSIWCNLIDLILIQSHEFSRRYVLHPQVCTPSDSIWCNLIDLILIRFDSISCRYVLKSDSIWCNLIDLIRFDSIQFDSIQSVAGMY